MRNLLPVDVEPLSEQRWAKVERSLMARLEAQPRSHQAAAERQVLRFGSRTWLAALAVLSALSVSVLAIVWVPQRATLDHPSRIATGESGSHLALPGFTLDVEPRSAVVVSAETPQGVLLVLDRGSIVCDVGPRSSDSPLVVQVGAARVRVVGTRFSVSRSGESARVEVFQGAVDVAFAGETHRVRAGEEWPRGVMRAPSDDPSSLADLQSSAQAASGSSSERSPLAHIAEDHTPRTKLPSSAPSKSRRAGVNESAGAASSATDPASQPVEPKPTQGPSSQAVFERATALERSDPARASQLYRSLELGTDSWAQNALYARGRLAASRGNPAEARRLLERYLERFPRGSNAEDARAVLRRLE